jgi:hypothetical protein
MAALACLVLPADFIERIEAADIVHVPSPNTGAAACHKGVILLSLTNLTEEKGLPSPPWHGSSDLTFQEAPVPTLFRFLLVVAILAGLGFAAMFALATFVDPDPREITVPVPTSRTPSSS